MKLRKLGRIREFEYQLESAKSTFESRDLLGITFRFWVSEQGEEFVLDVPPKILYLLSRGIVLFNHNQDICRALSAESKWRALKRPRQTSRDAKAKAKAIK